MTLVLWASACAQGDPPLLWRSRVEHAPLLEKLRSSGGDEARIHTVDSSGVLLQLLPGRRYKFVVTAAGAFRVAPLPADAPNNEYVHPVLAGGGPVQTGGSLWVTHAQGEVREVVLDADSKAFCPAPESLRWARAALARAGVPLDRVVVQGGPPACLGPAVPAADNWLHSGVQDPLGTVAKHLRGLDVAMVEVGLRFQELHWAGADGNWPLAAYQVAKIRTAVALAVERRPKRAASAAMLGPALDPWMPPRRRRIPMGLTPRWPD